MLSLKHRGFILLLVCTLLACNLTNRISSVGISAENPASSAPQTPGGIKPIATQATESVASSGLPGSIYFIMSSSANYNDEIMQARNGTVKVVGQTSMISDIAYLSPGGNKIVMANKGGGAAEDGQWPIPVCTGICIQNIDGSLLGKLDNIEIERGFFNDNFVPQIAWSPDGANITYGIADSANNQVVDIYVLNIATLNPVKVASRVSDYEPPVVWSPDGTQIAYSIKDGIILVSLKDLQSRLLVASTTMTRALFPAWSPDGSQVAYSLNSPTGWEIHLTRPDGSQDHAIPSVNGIYPVWSPDNKQLVFWSMPEQGFPDAYVINSDGSNLRKLGPTPMSMIAWSPDGVNLAMIGFQSSQTRDIQIVNTNNMSLVQTIPAFREKYYLFWTP